MLTNPTDSASAEYALIEDPVNDSRIAVRILSGEFEGCIYAYNELKAIEKDDQLVLRYDIDILTLPSGLGWTDKRRIKKGRGDQYGRLLQTVTWILDDYITTVDEETLYSDDDINWFSGDEEMQSPGGQ